MDFLAKVPLLLGGSVFYVKREDLRALDGGGFDRLMKAGKRDLLGEGGSVSSQGFLEGLRGRRS